MTWLAVGRVQVKDPHRSTYLDKDPELDIYTLVDANLVWERYRGARFYQRYLAFMGTLEDIADLLQKTRDNAPLSKEESSTVYELVFVRRVPTGIVVLLALWLTAGDVVSVGAVREVSSLREGFIKYVKEVLE